MIQFTKPAYLILLIPLAYYTYRLSRQSLADLSAFRSKTALILRTVILVMLVMSLAGARMVRDVSQQCVVFALDVSDSIPRDKRDTAVAYINSALMNLKINQKAGIVAFGGDASVELAPGNVKKIDKIYSVPTTNNTDISQALGLALAIFPEQWAKKIVLLSDGNETRGKALEQAMLAGANDVSIDVVPLTNELPHEALLDKMMSPGSAKVGEPFDIKIVAMAKEPVQGKIRILRNGAPAGTKSVELAKGKSVLTFQQSIDKPGNYEYKAILECARDTRPENNTAMAYTIVKGKPKVLYIEGVPGQSRYLAKAAGDSSILVETRDRSGIPNSLAQMQQYDMVVFSDTPAWNMAPEQMSMINSGVKDLGIGFTMIGGENSFGSGGYFDTPIEEALPVDMSLRKTKVLPSLSVVVVMDKSGSMSAVEGGMEKIQLANDAAASVVKLLQPIDYVGIIVCHSSPVAAVSLRSASNKDPIYSQISTIRAEGGGIAVFPSMQMAYDMISRSKTRQKHIILLADGADCDDQEGVIPLAKKMANEKITVTTVAIGDGPDAPFLKQTAITGKGNYYLARYARDLKAIFTKDVMSVSKSLIIEEPFTPVMDTSSPELDGIDPGSLPPLLGYVATSPKSTANVSMVSHKKDPILATWQYGLGRSAAFTSDCKARWGARWLAWPDYRRFWAQVLRSTMRKNTSLDFQTSVDITGGVGHVTVDAVSTNGEFLNLLELKGSVIGPDMKGDPITIEQSGPGRYEASFDAGDVGTYVVSVGKKGQKSGSTDVSVVSIPYPQEYKDITPNAGLLKRIASETSGSFNPVPKDVLTRNFKRSRAYTDLWRILAVLALILLPFDIAVRRISLEPGQMVSLWNSVLERVGRRRDKKQTKVSEQASETVGSLLQAKRRIPKAGDDPELAKKIGTRKSALRDMVAPEKPDPVEVKPPAPEIESTSTDQETPMTSRLLRAKKQRSDSDKNGRQE
ncbi:MAG: VWA domain-containing protein [Armatimonadota bacterium]